MADRREPTKTDAWLGAIRPALAVGFTAVLFAGACTGASPSERDPARGGGTQSIIPQPAVEGLSVAPDGERVDLAMPRFSDPTAITNPLFPVSRQASVLLLGRVDGEPFRTEVTLLPEPRIIEWDGQVIEALVSQYTAFLGGRIEEVAYDFYAQADDGSVWYLGEDVFNFRDGMIADTHGSWIAGRDGPGAMIMPADPQVGDVYRPENIPGFVFEEVTVERVDETVDGPFGPVEGALRIEELHMDGATEEKTFAPGYGEFFTSGGGDVEALALAVPTDAAASREVPHQLVAIDQGARAAFDAGGSKDWDGAIAAAREVRREWEGYRGAEAVPVLIEPRMSGAVAALARNAARHDVTGTRQAAIDVARSGLDLELRYRPVADVDLARFDLWLAQMLVDAAAGDVSAVNGDSFALDYTRDRILGSLEGSDMTGINTAFEELQGAVTDGDMAAVARAVRQMRGAIPAPDAS